MGIAMSVVMSRRPLIIVYFLVVYLPLEEFLLKWWPLSDIAFLMLRQLPDALVVALLMWTWGCSVLLGRRVPCIGGLADIALLSFFTAAILSALINHANPGSVAVNIKALLRYIALVYSLVALRPAPGELRFLFRLLMFGVGLQVVVGIVQLLGGIDVRNFLAGRNTVESLLGFQTRFTGTRYPGVNDLMGTMGNTINFAMFLLVGLVVWIVQYRTRPIGYWFGVAILLWLMLLTGSRSVFLVAGLVVLVHQLKHYPRPTLLLVLVGPALLLIFSDGSVPQAQTPLNNFNFAFMFTSDYIEMAKHQRLGVVLYVLPMWLYGPHFMLGYSADKAVFIQAFLDSRYHAMAPGSFAGSLSGVIEDVYWGALLVYYGLLGVVLFLTFYFGVARRVFRFARRADQPLLRQLGEVSGLLILASLPLNMLNQAFEIRQFSFYLWLFVGFSVTCYQRQLRFGSGLSRIAQPQVATLPGSKP